MTAISQRPRGCARWNVQQEWTERERRMSTRERRQRPSDVAPIRRLAPLRKKDDDEVAREHLVLEVW